MNALSLPKSAPRKSPGAQALCAFRFDNKRAIARYQRQALGPAQATSTIVSLAFDPRAAMASQKRANRPCCSSGGRKSSINVSPHSR
jgi:hypothetical protein